MTIQQVVVLGLSGSFLTHKTVTELVAKLQDAAATFAFASASAASQVACFALTRIALKIAL